MPRKTLYGARPFWTWPSFNEAAARCRGKPGVVRMATRAQLASMRPRPDAAENGGAGGAGRGAAGSFNEAAARCRGKRPRRPA